MQAVSAISSVGLSLNCKYSFVPSKVRLLLQFSRVKQFCHWSDISSAAQFSCKWRSHEGRKSILCLCSGATLLDTLVFEIIQGLRGYNISYVAYIYGNNSLFIDSYDAEVHRHSYRVSTVAQFTMALCCCRWTLHAYLCLMF